VISEVEYSQFSYHPYALLIGKISGSGQNLRADNDYIPPCFSISASQDLIGLHAELDQFLSKLEVLSSQIVQKIYRRNQQNEISELVLFLCDRIMLYLGQAITNMRWIMMHEFAALFACIASLARVMKNTIDLNRFR
jgi:predicted component of type VI protein secretion system